METKIDLQTLLLFGLIAWLAFRGCDGSEQHAGPTPPTEPAWVVIVEETSERTAEMGRLSADTPFWGEIEQAGHTWRFYDDDTPDAKSKGLDKLASDPGLPACVVMEQDGDVISKFKLPATAEAAKAEIRKVLAL